MLRMKHFQNQTIPEAGTRLAGLTMERMNSGKKGLLVALGRKWPMQVMRIVQCWQNCFKKLGEIVHAGVSRYDGISWSKCSGK